eukprot:632818_1
MHCLQRLRQVRKPFIVAQKRFIQTRTENGLIYAEHRFKSCTIRQIGAFQDNYIYFIRNHSTGLIGIVDAGDTTSAMQALHLWKETQFIGDNGIDFILNTHHHQDHCGANLDLKSAYPHAKIISYSKAQARLPGCCTVYNDGEIFRALDCDELEYELIDCGGHTKDHCAFMDYNNNLVFCGDTLFVMGCGRLFEGTAKQMYDSIQRIKSKCNENTVMFCAHEYSLSNARFAISIEPGNEDLQKRYRMIQIQRANNEWTVPCMFEDELKTNPFLRTHSLEIRTNLGIDKDSSDVDVFAAIRAAKDNF